MKRTINVDDLIKLIDEKIKQHELKAAAFEHNGNTTERLLEAGCSFGIYEIKYSLASITQYTFDEAEKETL